MREAVLRQRNPASQAAVKSGCSRKCSIPPQAEWAANEIEPRSCRVAAVLQSPLPDSNRRPPPYHVPHDATGGSWWQRIWLRKAVLRRRAFATGCCWLRPLGSISAPANRLIAARSCWRTPRRAVRCCGGERDSGVRVPCADEYDLHTLPEEVCWR